MIFVELHRVWRFHQEASQVDVQYLPHKLMAFLPNFPLLSRPPQTLIHSLMPLSTSYIF